LLSLQLRHAQRDLRPRPAGSGRQGRAPRSYGRPRAGGADGAVGRAVRHGEDVEATSRAASAGLAVVAPSTMSAVIAREGGDPVFQRRLWQGRKAAAYWIPRFRGE